MECRSNGSVLSPNTPTLHYSMTSDSTRPIGPLVIDIENITKDYVMGEETVRALRGVSLQGHGVLIADPDELFRVGVSVWERYYGTYTDELKPAVDALMNKRVAVRVDVKRIRSWDHRKLGLDPMEVSGSTARYLR